MSVDFGALAGAVTRDVTAAAQQVHDEAAAELDRFRTALPGITAAAHQHIDQMAEAMISWGESHLARLRQEFGLPDPATGQTSGAQIEHLPEGRFATVSGPAVNVPEGSVQLGDASPGTAEATDTTATA